MSGQTVCLVGVVDRRAVEGQRIADAGPDGENREVVIPHAAAEPAGVDEQRVDVVVQARGQPGRLLDECGERYPPFPVQERREGYDGVVDDMAADGDADGRRRRQVRIRQISRACGHQFGDGMSQDVGCLFRDRLTVRAGDDGAACVDGDRGGQVRVDLDADECARALPDAQRGLRPAAPLAWLGGSVGFCGGLLDDAVVDQVAGDARQCALGQPQVLRQRGPGDRPVLEDGGGDAVGVVRPVEPVGELHDVEVGSVCAAEVGVHTSP